MPQLIPRSYHKKLEGSLNELPSHDVLFPGRMLHCYNQSEDSSASEVELHCQNGKVYAGLSDSECSRHALFNTQPHMKNLRNIELKQKRQHAIKKKTF